jgi:hypothetical protein
VINLAVTYRQHIRDEYELGKKAKKEKESSKARSI